MSAAYDELQYPPVEGLSRAECEYLAFEDGRIAAAVHARAVELFTTYRVDIAKASNLILAISELRALAERIQSSATAYRDAQLRTPNTPRRPGLSNKT